MQRQIACAADRQVDDRHGIDLAVAIDMRQDANRLAGVETDREGFVGDGVQRVQNGLSAGGRGELDERMDDADFRAERRGGDACAVLQRGRRDFIADRFVRNDGLSIDDFDKSRRLSGFGKMGAGLRRVRSNFRQRFRELLGECVERVGGNDDRFREKFR